ncbi:MAG: ATP-binding cassette domain-containing protein, partial [Clostridiales bacterium]|nr:ATP-binding cassette domain-containing protein [Clostridiales bacterium]
LLADRAVVLHKGKIVLQGKPEEVFSQGEELAKYSLVMPRPVRICRALSEGGISVADSMDIQEIAGNIRQAISVTDGIQKEETKGAGTDSIAAPYVKNEEKGRIFCKNLSHVYNPKSPFATQALNGVDLEIFSGEFFGILGHTGSGKSTFVQHLNALIKVPTAEKKYKEKKRKKGQQPIVHLMVDGYDLTNKNTDFRELRSKVGMVFQYPEQQLFAETVFEDVAFGLKNFKPDISSDALKNAVREALETVGLDYRTVRGASPFELSGGQKRRVAIAGVIVTKPEILVLDEPAAGLDPLGKEEIMTLLHKIHADWCKTIIIVSHDMDEIAENCTRAAVFSEGRVWKVAAPKQLFSDVAALNEIGLDAPFAAKLTVALKEKGVVVDNDYTVSDFVEKMLSLAKTEGVCTSSEGGHEHA